MQNNLNFVAGSARNTDQPNPFAAAQLSYPQPQAAQSLPGRLKAWFYNTFFEEISTGESSFKTAEAATQVRPIGISQIKRANMGPEADAAKVFRQTTGPHANYSYTAGQSGFRMPSIYR
jgi:hypothetical protein